MAMSPRLLRPSGTFTPKSIPGLALWLDGSDTSRLYTTDAGPVTAVTAPTDISGCVGWWDSSDLSSMKQNSDGTGTVAAGDPVGYWADKSGTAAHVTGSGTARPTLTASAFNGYTALVFNGSTTNLSKASYTATNSLSGMTVLAVCANTSGVANLSRVYPAGFSGFWMNGGKRFYPDDTNFTGTSGGTSLAAGLYSFRFASSAVEQYDFGSIAPATVTGTIPSTTGSSASAALHVGSNIGANSFWNGPICEYIIFNRALTRAELASVERLLAAKWGISGVHTQATNASDPVGYWGDKSGNGRHATQATAGRRPTVSATALNGKKPLASTIDPPRIMSVPAWAYSNANSAIFVFRANALNQGIYQRGNINDQPRAAVQTPGGGVLDLRATRGGTTLAQTDATVRYPAGEWAIGATVINSSFAQAYRNGFAGTALTDTQTWSGNYGLNLFSLTPSIYPLDGGIAEFIYYDKQLTSSEMARVNRYLAAKYGITLAPQVSNLDAQDWVNRVYANGGTVSASTAAAVNTFCNDIDAAGIRDRFYRLNLMAGSFLGALVPLYRGPAYGGTTYGNSTDTNNSFITADYNETGASGGLQGNASAQKYLATGYAPLASGSDILSNGHLSLWPMTLPTSRVSVIGCRNQSGNNAFANLQLDNLGTAWGGWSTTTPVNGVTAGLSPQHLILTRRTDGLVYLSRNGSDVGGYAGVTAVAMTAEFTVFRETTEAGSNIGQSGIRMAGYSVGAALTSSQSASLYTAWLTFQQALSRV